jgi:hypothetical protein
MASIASSITTLLQSYVTIFGTKKCTKKSAVLAKYDNSQKTRFNGSIWNEV